MSVFIDETHEFLRLGGELSDALARSRSLGVAWHLAHQYREQFSSEVRATVDANTLNKIVFTLGSKDARELAAMAPELVSEDFMSLDQYEIYAHFMGSGRRVGWVSGRTLPPPPATVEPLDIIAASQQKYGQLADSEPTSAELPTPKPIDTPIGRKRRTHP